MCAMCMCDHVKQHRVSKATHITSVVDGYLGKMKDVANMAKEQQEQINRHQQTAEEYLDQKDKIKAELEQRLENLLKLHGQQKELASDRNSTIMQCHENILKATKLCEHKIKEKVNTKHIKTVITDLIQKRQYWQAYQKVTKAIAEGAKLDDQEIIAELARWKDLNSKLSQQLADLQTQPKDLEEYQRLRQENEQLRQDKDTLISIFDVLINFRGARCIPNQPGSRTQSTRRTQPNCRYLLIIYLFIYLRSTGSQSGGGAKTMQGAAGNYTGCSHKIRNATKT